MSLMLSVVLFLLIASVGALVGKKFWVEPAQAVERVKAAEMAVAQQPVRHPSVMIHELIARMGDLIPASPKDITIMQKRMMRAGIRNPNALKVLYGAKAILGITLPIATWLLVANSEADPSNKAIFVMASAALGFFGPNEFVKVMAGQRQHAIQKGLPNALDLMVISVESGLGLDQAIMQVANELAHAYPAIAEEFLMVNLELKAGKRRRDALRNLGERAGVEDLKKLVAVLIQADRFGTSIGESLRSHSEYMRVQARQVAEEKAAKLGVKLIFPIFFFILPSLFVITVGPVAVRIVRDLLPMMNNM
jgi:tight adherence protein C